VSDSNGDGNGDGDGNDDSGATGSLLVQCSAEATFTTTTRQELKSAFALLGVHMGL